MNKNDFLTVLEAELKKQHVPDIDEIVSEYEQHFAFKQADGYEEEEIAARLGEPLVIAAQFDSEEKARPRGGTQVFLRSALGFFALFEGSLFVTFLAWVVAVAATSIASAVIGVSLIGGVNVASLLPPLPYGPALLFGIAFLAFSVLMAGAAHYFFAYTRQAFRSVVRWNKTVVSGRSLPPLPWSPQFSGRHRRILNRVLLYSVTVFGIFSVVAYAVSALSADALEFWHVWNWFV